jgi:hypothetical protein
MTKKIKLNAAQEQAAAEREADELMIANDVSLISLEVVTLHALEDSEAVAGSHRKDQIARCIVVHEKTRAHAQTQHAAAALNALVAKYTGLDVQTVKNMTSYSVQIATNLDALAEAEAAGDFKAGKLYKLSTICSKLRPYTPAAKKKAAEAAAEAEESEGEGEESEVKPMGFPIDADQMVIVSSAMHSFDPTFRDTLTTEVNGLLKFCDGDQMKIKAAIVMMNAALV